MPKLWLSWTLFFLMIKMSDQVVENWLVEAKNLTEATSYSRLNRTINNQPSKCFFSEFDRVKALQKLSLENINSLARLSGEIDEFVFADEDSNSFKANLAEFLELHAEKLRSLDSMKQKCLSPLLEKILLDN